MTTGDEPALSQSDPDNAPMISGRGTKIIADARGAYLAGNLRALTELMTSEQVQRYRTVVLDEAIAVMRAFLSTLGLTDPSAHPALSALARLMAAPDSTSVGETLSCFFHPERVPEHHAAMLASTVSDDTIATVAGTIMPFVSMIRSTTPLGFEQSMWVVLAMAGQRLRERGYLTEYWWAGMNITTQQVHAHVQRWLIDAAWAVLIGKPIPSFDDTSRFGAASMLG